MPSAYKTEMYLFVPRQFVSLDSITLTWVLIENFTIKNAFVDGDVSFSHQPRIKAITRIFVTFIWRIDVDLM